MTGTVINNWKPHEDDQLRLLWTDKSATEIGKLLGRSKGSVISRVQRLKLHKPKQVSLKPRPKRESRRADNFGIRLRFRKEVEHKPLSNLMDVPFLGINLFDISRDQCRFMKTSESMLFCGHKTKEGSSYCNGHHEHMYRIKETNK